MDLLLNSHIYYMCTSTQYTNLMGVVCLPVVLSLQMKIQLKRQSFRFRIILYVANTLLTSFSSFCDIYEQPNVKHKQTPLQFLKVFVAASILVNIPTSSSSHVAGKPEKTHPWCRNALCSWQSGQWCHAVGVSYPRSHVSAGPKLPGIHHHSIHWDVNLLAVTVEIVFSANTAKYLLKI